VDGVEEGSHEVIAQQAEVGVQQPGDALRGQVVGGAGLVGGQVGSHHAQQLLHCRTDQEVPAIVQLRHTLLCFTHASEDCASFCLTVDVQSWI